MAPDLASANTISLAPVSDGEALRYVVRTNPVRRHPPIDKVRRVRERRDTKRPASRRS